MDKQQEFALRTVEERDVRFIRLWFTDVLGTLKSVAIAPAELEAAFEEGLGFDGSAIEGMTRVSEDDMIVQPDPSTFQILPWRGGPQGTARMFCDILTPDGEPSLGDPRHVLKRTLAKAKDKGLHVLRASGNRVLPVRKPGRLVQGPDPDRRGRLLRPRAAQPRHGLPPRHREHARANGHLGGILAP